VFAFVDESGNTGENLFDESQPRFITGALITRSDFDLSCRAHIARLTEQLGTDVLHARHLGIGRIEEIALPLLKILKKANARFFISHVEKKYLAITKMVDTLFDSGENFAVPWHTYNIRALRMLMVFKLAALVDEDLARAFWSCLMRKNREKAYHEFVAVCDRLLPRVHELPDERSRQLVSEAVGWARANPETIHLHSSGKVARYGHLPNMVAFTNLLDGLEIQSRLWDRPVRRIKHDRQMQFEKSLDAWHDIFANASPDPYYLPGGEKHVMRKVFGSEFVMSSASESVGIQTIDIIIWLFRQSTEGNGVPENCFRLMNFVFRRGRHHDFSFEGASQITSELFDKVYSKPVTEEMMEKAQELLTVSEERRQAKMREYREEKLLASRTAAISKG
jgi:hypothetical protein